MPLHAPLFRAYPCSDHYGAYDTRPYYPGAHDARPYYPGAYDTRPYYSGSYDPRPYYSGPYFSRLCVAAKACFSWNIM